MAVNRQSDYIYYLKCKMKALLSQVAAFKSGRKYRQMQEEHERALRREERRNRELEAKLADAHKENVSIRKAWSEIFDDLDKEHKKELAEKDRQIKKMEKRALKAERLLDEALDRLTATRRRLAKACENLETSQGNIQKLKAQVNRDFENSSIPSSGKERQKKVSNSREKTGRKPGGQPGHKGHCRLRLEPTETVTIPPTDELASNPVYYPTGKMVHKQVVDAKVIVTVTDYQTPEYRNRENCSRCHAPFPAGVHNEVNYGCGLKALAYVLNNYCNVSIGKTTEFIRDITQGAVNLSVGMVNGLGREFSEKTQGSRREIFSELLLSPAMYTDFTVSKVNGENKAVMVCTDGEHVLYFARDHKGHKGIQGTPVEDYQFTLVHDHDTTFLSYGGAHQECLSHVLRYLKDSMENEPGLTWNKDMHAFLRRMIHEVKQMNRKVPEEKCVEYEAEYDRILKKAEEEYKDSPPTKYYMDGFNLQKRLRKDKGMQLFFLRHPEVDYTNNISERHLRLYKRKQKQATSFRSDLSVGWLCNALSMIETGKEHGTSAYETVYMVFA